MKFLYLLSNVYAMTDYFATVEQAIASSETRCSEVVEPSYIKSIDCNSCPIPVASIAVHGGNIEAKSDTFAKDLYKALPSDISQDSTYYAFGTDMNSKESMMLSSDRCLRAPCCRKIVNPHRNSVFDAKQCKEETYLKRIEDRCEYKYICYENALHITSSNFTTPRLNEAIKNRFVVSWHGFSSRKAGDDHVDVIFGGLFKHKKSVAEKFVKITNGDYVTVFCKGKDDCYTVPDETPVDVNGLEGVHEKNVANLGRSNAGLHIELSRKFRIDKERGGHEELLQAIICNLPKYNNEISE